MFIHVNDCKYIDGYCLELSFNNNEKRMVDLSNELDGEIFEPLRDINKFKKFHIVHNTVEWENGADFSPEFLYEIGKQLV